MNFKLDKWDASLIHLAKHATSDTEQFIKDAYDLWKERCGLPIGMTDWRIGEAIFNRFLPLILEINPYQLQEILRLSDPNHFRWVGRPPIRYWDLLMYNTAMALAVTNVVDLPGYVDLVQELELD